MSQEWISGEDRRWQMQCNVKGCTSVEDPTPGRQSLLSFARRGWFIAEVFGDACPDCVADGKVDPNATSLFPRLWEARQEELRASKDGRS